MLSEISQIEKDKYCMESLICGVFKKEKKKGGTQKQRVKRWLSRSLGVEEIEEVGKRYKLSAIRGMKSEALTYSLETLVDNTVLCN